MGDFIDISTATSLAMVSLYHAKHGRRALSASGFHESVGQAIKNPGRMTLPSESIPAKYASWERVYRGPKTRTTIPRIVRGGRGSRRPLPAFRVLMSCIWKTPFSLPDQKLAAVMRVLPQAATGILKDSYLLDFLDPPDRHSKSDLQTGLLRNLLIPPNPAMGDLRIKESAIPAKG